MTFIVTVLHILACIVLILIVLLQTGKGADIGASMGGAGGQALFGPSGGATLLSKITTGIAILFMLTSLYLAYQSGHKVKASIMDSVAPTAETAVPNAPADTPAPAETPESPVPAPEAEGK